MTAKAALDHRAAMKSIMLVNLKDGEKCHCKAIKMVRRSTSVEVPPVQHM